VAAEPARARHESEDVETTRAILPIGHPSLEGWLTAREAAQKTGWGLPTIQQRARWQWATAGLAAREKRPGRGAFQWRIDPRALTSSPRKVRIRLTVGVNERRDLAAISRRLAKAEQRAAVVIAVLHMTKVQGASRNRAMDRVIQRWGGRPDCILKISRKSIAHWLKLWEQFGLIGLVDDYYRRKEPAPMRRSK
jgi:hypothetical protein